MEQVKKAPVTAANVGLSADEVAVLAVDDHEVTVLAVDDHDGFREVLRDVIGAAPGFELVGEASSGEEATRAIEPLAPDLVLMDIAMPGMGGVAAAREIISRYPSVALVFVSANDPSLNPEVAALGDAVGGVRKQDLGPGRLRELWESRAG